MHLLPLRWKINLYLSKVLDHGPQQVKELGASQAAKGQAPPKGGACPTGWQVHLWTSAWLEATDVQGPRHHQFVAVCLEGQQQLCLWTRKLAPLASEQKEQDLVDS